MTFIIIFLMVVGAGAIVGIPIRLLQLARGNIQIVYAPLKGISKVVVTLGLAGLVLAAILWFGLAYVAVMVFTDDAQPRKWGISELAMVSNALGFLYLVVELLLIPLTIRQIRNVRAATV